MGYSYKEAVDYIEETPKFTKKNSLEHTKECLWRLGNPEKSFQVIHVAGTNGKGSTCAFLTSILREAGYSCGLFTSPHLVEINERFQINEANIDNETFLKAFEKVKALSDGLVEEGSHHPTYFEMLFLMGMVIFAEAGVEIVILETGLGGRLDATTAVEHPLACVITSISLDHTQYLGNTIPEIAGEKAGIIVPKTPVIYDGNDQEAAAVIEKRARELGSPAFMVKKEDARILAEESSGIDFLLGRGCYKEIKFHIPFVARYQVMNAALALRTMEVLGDHLAAPRLSVQKGLEKTRWQGRMETILPGVIVDGAHNEDGVRKFVETAAGFQKKHPLTLLFSSVNDKDYKDMIRTICGRISFDHVITTQVGGERQVLAEELAMIFRENGCPYVECVVPVKEAFKKACQARKKDGLLFCVGSLYLVGQVKAAIQEKD